jgi:hypothetical protein
MKRKPDISSVSRPSKDPTAFLEGGSADRSENGAAPAAEAPAAAPAPTAKAAPAPAAAPSPAPSEELVMPVATVQKLFRLRWDTANALRMGAAQLSTKQGKRVTETEIVERLIRAHFKLDS